MLRIGKLTDYAIVVLAHMARNAHRCVHPATDLSEQTSVPLPTVQKILKVLAREGLVVSMRGARGGYALAADPAGTSLVQILEAMEGPLAMTDCATASPHACHDSATCAVSGHWPLISQTVRGALAGVTLLDLSRTRPGAPSADRSANVAVSPRAPSGSPRVDTSDRGADRPSPAPLPAGVRS